MAGEEDLSTVIKSMSPSLDDETLVFAHIKANGGNELPYAISVIAGMSVQMLFWENEGWTVILPEREAKEISLQAIFPCKKITLNVHSSLDAVGFMAAITTKLTQLRIGVNPVSGYFHDHLFVPVGKEDEVMEALKEMAEEVKT